MVRVSTTPAGERYSVGIPFARTLDSDETDALEGVLETIAVPNRGFTPDRYTPTTVDVTPTYARVELDLHAPENPPATIAGAIARLIGEWAGDHGPIGEATRLGGADELVSLPAPSLSLSVDAARLTDRLEAKHAGEAVASAEAIRGYAVAFPERPLTEPEQTAVETYVEGDLLVDARYVAFLDAAAPSVPAPTASPTVRLRRALDSVDRPDVADELADRGFWPTRETGTLPSLGADEADVEAALRERAVAQSPHPAPEDGEGDVDERATS
jgi:hypothetical protein